MDEKTSWVFISASSKYWLGIFNELKNRGLKDILILCADGLTGIKESIAVAYPDAEYQRCIVHQIRNILKYVSYKHRKDFANDLKSIYTAATEELAHSNSEEPKMFYREMVPGSQI